MLTARPWDAITSPETDPLAPSSAQDKTSAADKAKMKAKMSGYVQQYAPYIADVLATVPRDMLLLFKTNDCLRHVDRMLGTPVNTFLITARTCVEALSRERLSQFPGIQSWLQGVLDWLALELRVGLFRLSMSLKSLAAN